VEEHVEDVCGSTGQRKSQRKGRKNALDGIALGSFESESSYCRFSSCTRVPLSF
jgi:hypothetical protein